MEFKKPLISGKLIQRYKRFLADIELPKGKKITAHCPNSGSMLGCQKKGSRVLLSNSKSTTRKLDYTWEMVRVGKTWVGINTQRPNEVIYEAIHNRELKEFADWKRIKREKKVSEKSRIDIWLEDNYKNQTYIEIKNVTLFDSKTKTASFPDAVTERGQKHLRELARLKRKGHRAVLIFFLNREDAECVSVAAHIDPAYSKELHNAIQGGVEILVYQAKLTPKGITIKQRSFFDPFIPSENKKLRIQTVV